jgi:hypothetical protein
VEVGNYKIPRRGGILRLYMADKFNKDKINVDIIRNVTIKSQRVDI